VRAYRALPNPSPRCAPSKIRASACDQLAGRVVGKDDLAREPRAEPGIRVEERPHEARVAGDDHDQPVPVVLHPLEERLHRLGAEVETSVALARRERVGLVDEEHAVECAPDGPIRFERRGADVLADERRAVDLDEMALLQEAHRAVHLREQARNRRLTRPRVAEEDQVLARGHFGQVVLLAAGLHLQEGDQRVHLLLHRFEPDEGVELGLQLCERQRREAARGKAIAQPVLELGPGRTSQLIAKLPHRLEWVGSHSEKVARRLRSETSRPQPEGPRAALQSAADWP
jgi:hypothetical protein